MPFRTIPLAGLLLAVTAPALAQPNDIFTLISRLGDEMNREFIVDPRIPREGFGWSTDGEDADYDSLLGILRTAGFVAVETAGNQILLVPDSDARSTPSPLLQEDDRRVSDHAIVTRIIDVEGLPPAQLVPILRPMMTQSAQMGAIQGTNKLILVDRYDNIRRITRAIEEILDGLTTE